jgi:hypothetical protein
MARRPSIGYPTITAAEAAIREIVSKYDVEQEFFHPLLQQLFIEQPYWCDPPGPVCTMFKWVLRELPTGASARWFMAYCDEAGWKGGDVVGWKGVSWKKAVRLFKFSIIDELKAVAQLRTSVLKNDYRKMHPYCEYAGCSKLADHVHHVIAMKQIIAVALSSLTETDHVEVLNLYDWTAESQFMLPDNHKFMRVLLDQHKPGVLMSVCRRHHNDLEGKQTHNEDPKEQFT